MEYEVRKIKCQIKMLKFNTRSIVALKLKKSREPLYSNAMHYSLMSCIRTGELNVIIGPSYGTSIAEDKLSENKLYSRLIKTTILIFKFPHDCLNDICRL